MTSNAINPEFDTFSVSDDDDSRHDKGDKTSHEASTSREEDGKQQRPSLTTRFSLLRLASAQMKNLAALKAGFENFSLFDYNNNNSNEDANKDDKTTTDQSATTAAAPEESVRERGSLMTKFSLLRLASAQIKNLAAVSEIETIAQKKGAVKEERFRVVPDTNYPDTYMDREELRKEMNKKSTKFHKLQVENNSNNSYNGHPQIGELRLEILQCFGLPTSSLLREVSAYCTAVCGPHAFKTDTMPPVANPMWLCRMRRACVIPIYHGFARLFIGCFDNTTEAGSLTDFIGRIVLDLARVRPMCTYDVTVPLRASAHVFERQKLGSIRIRIHLTWNSERDVVLSYIPKTIPKFRPNEEITVNCLDDKSFRDVALVVHGKHMPGRFSMTLLKATVREMKFTQIHIMRYLKKREIYNLRHYTYPFISGFVFLAWMHCVYVESVRYAPGHFITYILLHLFKNYAYYSMDSKLSNGFLPPTIEELFSALVFGSKDQQQNNRSFIEPLDIIVDDSHAVSTNHHIEKKDYVDDDYEEANTEPVSLARIAESMRKSLPLHTYTHYFRKYPNCFLGTEAVDFLLAFGFAYTRDEAVILGRKLERESKLFEHIEGKLRFDDLPIRYHFLSYDTHKYIIKGHEPRGKKIFEAIGFLDDHGENERNAHVPFPFATGKDHPRFTVKQSLVVRSNRGKKLLKEQLKKEQEFEKLFGEDADDLNCASSIDTGANSNDEESKEDAAADLAQLSSSSRYPSFRFSKFAYDDLDVIDGSHTQYDNDGEIDEVNEKQEEDGAIIEEKTLMAPPNQDMGVASGKDDKKLPETLQETRHRVHNAFLHVFNEPTYRIDPNLYSVEMAKNNKTTTLRLDEDFDVLTDVLTASNNTIRGLFRKGKKKNKNQGGRKSKKKNDKDKNETDNFQDSIKSKNEMIATTTPYDRRKNEYDRVLGLGKHSGYNVMMNRIGVVLQPMVESAQAFLFFFRSLFNIFTWQDPILSFWVAVLGILLVLIFHFAPWRNLFGIMGIVLFGPQNWIIRIMKERNGTYEAPNFDRIIKKKEEQRELNWDELPYFSKNIKQDGNPGRPDDLLQVKQVIVPYSKFKFSARFSDWPPESEYAKVYESPPPTDAVDDTCYRQNRSPLFDSDRDNNNDETRTQRSRLTNKSLKKRIKMKKLAVKNVFKAKKGLQPDSPQGPAVATRLAKKTRKQKCASERASGFSYFFSEFQA